MKIIHLLLASLLSIGITELPLRSVSWAGESPEVESKLVAIKEIWFHLSYLSAVRGITVLTNDRDVRELEKILNLQNGNSSIYTLPSVNFSESIAVFYHQSETGCKRPNWQLQARLTTTGNLLLTTNQYSLVPNISATTDPQNVIFTGNCNAIHSHTTLSIIDRANIKKINGEDLSEYKIKPVIDRIRTR